MKYCTNSSCSRNYLGVSKEEGKICPCCGADIDHNLTLKIKNIGNDIENLGRKIGRKRMKKTLVGLLLVSAITAEGVGLYNGVSGYFNSPEYIQAKEERLKKDKEVLELRDVISYVLPTCKNHEEQYNINGHNIKVLKGCQKWDNAKCTTLHALYVKIDDKLEFVSGTNNLGTLNLIKEFDGDKCLIYEKDKIQNYTEFQTEYINLIKQIAEKKKEMDNNLFSRQKELLNDLVKVEKESN